VSALAALAFACPALAAPARETEPIVLSGRDFPDWSARADHTLRLPLLDLADCQSFDEQCEHNHYAEPQGSTQQLAPQQGTPTRRLLGYRWDEGWQQIPFQVDERFERYLANPASGFAVYSGEDRHTTYAFQREGFRWTESDPADPCLARPASPPAVDPVQGLDDDDELAFMARDAGAAAPSDTPLPPGIEAARRVAVADPLDPGAEPRYAYVMLAAPDGPAPEFDAASGYVRYERDANADIFEKSESSYDGYGNAARGTVCDDDGNVVAEGERRRPRDTAWITTPRYRFRYDGRWLMTQIQISDDGGAGYGPDLVDRWKARAFAQDPGSETPCCGFEEEDTNWGGSSTLLGELSGPVRTIRETWGADSGTNVIRRETFYREEMRQATYLRVHPIPPLDGIYAQWDFNAGRMTRFYNSRLAEGVAVDGRNDELLGNLDDPCNVNYDGNDTSDLDQGFRGFYRDLGLCDLLPYHQSVDVPDLTVSEPNSALGWNQTSGPHGTIVDRYSARLEEATPGGLLQSVLAVPYYRDDACFDDGTGSDPGPKVRMRSGDEPRTYGDPPQPRECWQPDDGLPDGSERFFQGSIGTHGLHILLIADSDNLRLTVPLTEIVGEQRMVMLPGDPGNVGERYGQGFERPLVPVVTPVTAGG
jgi:hypothetical protein